jgi:predicted secreted protein
MDTAVWEPEHGSYRERVEEVLGAIRVVCETTPDRSRAWRKQIVVLLDAFEGGVPEPSKDVDEVQ